MHSSNIVILVVLVSKVRTILYRDEMQKAVHDGAFKVHEVAKAAYGPRAGNVAIEKHYGAPVLSRDGVTNIQEVVLSDPNENMAAQFIIGASRKSNQKVGDGTTAVAILSYHLLKESQKLNNTYNSMEIVEFLNEASIIGVRHVDKIKKKINSRLLRKVAGISSGTTAIGDMIADTIETVGIDGGVIVEESTGMGITNEVVDGFYFQKGFTHPYFINDQSNLKAIYKDVAIIITEKRLATVADIAPILTKLLESGIKEMIFIGEVVEEALQVLALNKGEGKLMATVVEPPNYGGGPLLFLEDLAVATGGQVYTAGSDGSNFRIEMIGEAKQVVINEFSTTIIGAGGNKEDIQARIHDLREQLKVADHPVTLRAIRDRLSKLSGKIGIIRVGGALDIDRSYQKLRVDDAVAAVQAAMRDGIVPGGGVTLATVKGTKFDDAFKQPFLQLAENAGANPMKLLGELSGTKDHWYGFNFEHITPKPVNLLREGVLDPSLVAKETIINAVTVASNLITIGAGITYKDREEVK
jgi:chaperonin GroEL